MTLIASQASLLHAALTDLHAGKRDAAHRLPGIAAKAGAALADMLRREAEQAGVQAARLAASGSEMRGPENLWMAGILADAERDGRQTEPGPLLDIALVGAVRKAKAAEIVSSETAIALAAALGDEAIGAAVTVNRREEIASDRALKALLAKLTG